MSHAPRWIVVAVAGCGLLTPAVGRPDDLPPPAARKVDFGADILPILEATCARCHGTKAAKGGLSLATRDDALRGGDGGPAILPGKGAESPLVRQVAGVDDPTMPPEGAGKPLGPDQVGLIRAWIDQGASWGPGGGAKGVAGADHWSFRRPARPPLPAVRQAGWARNPIDAFVLGRLDREGMAPSPEADRATILRRLSLDLIGLPPSIAELDAFLGDRSAVAYERQVDRLLASPHYGERWARRWLDRARYADTNGYEKDRERSIWPYRDWVIHALNRDLPFDRFTVEQVAGDLLPGATTSEKVATGFHRNTMTNEEGGIDVEEFRFAAVVDRVATTGSVWLGLTIGCAQCHTHKFDPITQREYYRLFALLDNADEPDLPLPDPATEARRAAIEAEAVALERSRAGAFPTQDEWLGWIFADPEPAGRSGPPLPEAERRRRHLGARLLEWERGLATSDWSLLEPVRAVSRKRATLEVRPDLSILARGDKPNNDVYEVDLAGDLDGATGLRLEVLPDPSLPDDGPGRAPLFSVGDFILTEIAASLVGPGGARPLAIASATEDYAEPGHPARLAIDGQPDTGWTVKGGIGRPHAAVFALREPVAAGPRARLRLTLRQEGIHQTTIGRFRIAATRSRAPVASGLPDEVERIVRIPAPGRTTAQAEAVRDWFLATAPELASINARIAGLRRSKPRPATTMVMEERRPAEARVTRIHRRGEFLQPLESVEPGVPADLHPLPSDAPRNRLGLALWLVAPDNPLTARVHVNQAWQAFFGRGIVPTVDDFGTRGERPSHPDLLDWLATEAVRLGWSQKALHRLIVTSATYRQSSATTPAGLARDPVNLYLARGPRFRVEAEAVRDIALGAAGLLDGRVGGPSVYPPQPDGVTALAYGMGSWPTSSGADRYRRGLYTYIKRAAPFAAFGTFDAPSSEGTCTRRERSNTPLQALTLLNDPAFQESARALAARTLREAPASTPGRVRHAFRLCTGRPPRPDEEAMIVAFLDRQRDRARAGDLKGLDVDDERAAWTATARVLLNLDETITKE